MGTNYKLYYNQCKCCGRSDNLHIGKLNDNYKFLFQKIKGKAENVAQWKELTLKGEIIDEYGKVWSYKKFWTLVEDKQTAKYTQGEWIEGYDFSSGDFS